MKHAPLPASFPVKGEHVVVVMRELRTVRHSENGYAILFAGFVDLPFHIHGDCTCAFILKENVHVRQAIIPTNDSYQNTERRAMEKQTSLE